MKKWLEYQFKNQIKNFDWENRVWKVDNLSQPLGLVFKDIQEGFNSGRTPTEYENVFMREDHIKRTAASTGGEVSENEYRSWLNEYFDLMAGQRHHYINEFSGHEELIRKTFAETFDLQPDTIKFRVQVEIPGRYFVVHTDRNRYKAWDQEPEMRYERVAEQQQHKIFVTFMQDQELGQIFGFGKKTINWNCGDTVTWEHQSVPHYTANVGYHANFMLVTTGMPNIK
jgi:hypothetical protein